TRELPPGAVVSNPQDASDEVPGRIIPSVGNATKSPYTRTIRTRHPAGGWNGIRLTVKSASPHVPGLRSGLPARSAVKFIAAENSLCDATPAATTGNPAKDKISVRLVMFIGSVFLVRSATSAGA